MSSLPSSPNLSHFSPDLSSTSSPDLSQSVTLHSSCNLFHSTNHSPTTPPPHSPNPQPRLLRIDATPKNPPLTKNWPPSPPRSAPPARLAFSPAISAFPFSPSHPTTRTRANSLTSPTLAERRRSKTSAYLSSEHFKQDFASKLRSLKARERSLPTNPPLSPPPTLTEDVPSLTRSLDSDSSFDRHPSQHDDHWPGLPTSNVPPKKNQLRVIIDRLLLLPPKELAVQLEIQFSRFDTGRDADELEARNEVISTLADQLAHQLEAKEKILADLECLRSAHASLCTELADARDEIASSATRGPLCNQQVAQLRRESDVQIRHLRQALQESKQALFSLRYDQAPRERRRSLQSHHSTFNTLLSGAPLQRPSSVSILGIDRGHDVSCKPSSTDSPTSGLYGASHFPDRTSWRPHNELSSARRSSLLSIFGNPTRPSKNQAPTGLSSPVITEESSHQEELASLRLQCTQLQMKLKESEDSRLASQAALDALKTFISSSSQTEVSNVKLPPLPTEMESFDSKPRWGLLGRSLMVNPPASPNAAATFSDFLWGKKSRENDENEGRQAPSMTLRSPKP